MRVALFLAILILLTGIIHAYLWMRLIAEPAWPLSREALTWTLATLASLIPFGMVFRRVLPKSMANFVNRLGYLWMGIMFYLVVFLVPSDVYRIGRAAIDALTGFRMDPLHRETFGRITSMIAVLGTFVCVVWGVTSARNPRVKRVPVRLQKLPESFFGFRIAQLSDVHVGPNLGRTFVQKMVTKTNELKPDIVVITGDLVDGSVHSLASEVAPLAKLIAKHGVYFVTGNHEYYSGAPGWIEHLAELGIRVLRNEHVTFEKNGQALNLAGVNDWTAGEFIHSHAPDIALALEGRDPRQPVVLLAHQPKAVHEAAIHDVDLVLSGHTHGGQLVPFNFIVRLVQPFVAGLHRVRNTQIYVSSGTGYWGPPMRVGAPSEIALIELRNGP